MARTNSPHSKKKQAPKGRAKQGARTKAATGGSKGRTPGKLFEGLVALQARLRAPKGCPWDREQTHDTLRPYLIEETYEVLDALDSGDAAEIAGELGDLLLQVVFHAQLGAEAGRFDIADVIEHIHTKMVRRHPHVFGTVKADTAAQVLKNWEQIKAEERREGKPSKLLAGGPSKLPAGEQSRQSTGRALQNSGGQAHQEAGGQARGKDAGGLKAEGPKAESVLDGVPRSLPGLLEAHQLTKKAANVGFDWKDAGGILEKLTEEMGEFRDVLASGNRSRREDELGDLLFVCVNLARFSGLDSEIALKKANRKFAGRFREMERLASGRQLRLANLSAEEWEALWNQAKRSEGQKEFA